jgi:hypothetical protein
MATALINTVLDHTSDAGFRAWVAEFITLLGTGGALVQTADTGQINTATVNRPVGIGNAGYAVFRFDDSLQSTAPYFFRFDFGTGTSTNIPRIQLTIGTGSNGSGTITGSIFSVATIGANMAPTSVAVAYPSYACGHAGTIGIAFKQGSSGNAHLYVGFHRVRSTSGTQTGEGLIFVVNNEGSSLNSVASMRVFRIAGSVTYGGSSANSFCLIPLLVTSSAPSGGDPRFYRHFCSIPDQRPMLESGTVMTSEAAAGSTFPARPFGASDRTYLSLGGELVRGALAGGVAGSTTYAFAMLYD